MRFDEIEIPAFGPFRDLRLDFGKPEADLHVIYGPNEAGKSSLLRAISALLYEIPRQSVDNFQHDYKRLLVGATVSEGTRRLTFFRKKGNAGTLLDAGRNSLDEGELRAFCGSVNAEFFHAMFGLDSERLRSGAQELLSGEGELGTLLFSASLGGAAIDAAIKTLKDEAVGLLTATGRAGSIHAALRELAERERQARDQSITTNAWKTLRSEIAEAERIFGEEDGKLAAVRERLARLERLRQAIPLVAEEAELRTRLGAIALPPLASDFAERVRAAQGELAGARVVVDERRGALVEKRRQLDEIEPFDAILADAPTVESLHRGIARHEEDVAGWSEKTRGVEDLRTALADALAGLGLPDSAALAALPEESTGESAEFEALANQLAVDQRRAEQCRGELAATRAKLVGQRKKLALVPAGDATPVVADLVGRVADHNLDAKVVAGWRGERAEVERRRAEVARRLGRDDEIGDIPVPALARLEALGAEREGLREAGAERRRRLDEVEAELVDSESSLAEASADIAVFTERDLAEARAERDRVWNEMANAIRSGTKVGAGEVESLTAAFRRGDEIADALRQHAERLGRVATLTAERARLEKHRERCRGALDDLAVTVAAADARWAAELAAFSDRDPASTTPTEMIEWRADWVAWCELAGQIDSLAGRIARHEAEEAGLLAELRAHFAADTGSYGVLSNQLTAARAEADAARGKREAIAETIAELEFTEDRQRTESAEADAAALAVAARWTEAIEARKLVGAASPEAALATIRDRREARSIQRRLVEAESELRSLEERVESYRDRLTKLRTRHLPTSPPLDPADPGASEGRLSELLAGARVRQTRWAALSADVVGLTETLRQRQAEIEAATVRRDELVREAALESADDLPEAILAFEERRKVEGSLDTLRRTLRGLAGSVPLPEFAAEAGGQDGDRVEGELRALGSELEGRQSSRDEARDALNEVAKRRADLERAGDEAANAKQLAANAQARIVTDSERFVRLQHAITFLEAQVEAYRERTQGPMIARTSEFFRTLTGGSFAGVAAQVSEKDAGRIELVALRGADEERGGAVETLATDALSEGTRDQIFLALRLAAIDTHLERHAPMPLILDDVLMTFDDERARAVLAVLRVLAAKTQVLVFTHHRHVVGLAEEILPAGQILELDR